MESAPCVPGFLAVLGADEQRNPSCSPGSPPSCHRQRLPAVPALSLALGFNDSPTRWDPVSSPHEKTVEQDSTHMGPFAYMPTRSLPAGNTTTAVTAVSFDNRGAGPDADVTPLAGHPLFMPTMFRVYSLQTLPGRHMSSWRWERTCVINRKVQQLHVIRSHEVSVEYGMSCSRCTSIVILH